MNEYGPRATRNAAMLLVESTSQARYRLSYMDMGAFAQERKGTPTHMFAAAMVPREPSPSHSAQHSADA